MTPPDADALKRAYKVVADVVDGAIRAGDDWTWKNESDEEDPELTRALRWIAAHLAKKSE